MLTSSRYGIQYPQSTDSPNVPRDLTAIVTALETSVMFTQGALASRPVSTAGAPGKTGRLFATTDQSPNRLFYDYGTGWFDVGALVAGSVDNNALAALAVTAAKIANDTITAAQIAPDAIGNSELGPLAVTDAEVATANKDGAVAIPSLRTLGVGSAQAAAGNDSRLSDQRVPTANSVDSTKVADGALTPAKTAGTAVINNDARLSDQRTPADASVTVPKLAASVPIIPVGGMIDWPWGSGSIPAWAALPYGQLLTSAAFAAMQAVADAAGRPYGGVAGTNFNMPDMRGRVAAGKDDMGGTAANRITAAISGAAGSVLGAVIGSEGVALTTGQIPAHNHGVTDPGHSHTVNAHSHTVDAHTHGVAQNAHYHGASHTYWTGDPGGELGPQGAVAPGASTFYGSVALTGALADISITSASPGTDAQSPGTTAVGTGISTQNAGGGGAHLNMQPTIVVNQIMRVT